MGKTKAEPKKVWYEPQRGDRVRLRYDDDDTWGEGVVVAAGEQQSTWRADSDRQDRHVTNGNLVLVEKAKEGVRPSTAARAPTRAKIEATGFPLTARLVRLKQGNPKRPGTGAHARWELLFSHCEQGTVADFLKDAGNPTTLRNAVAQGYVEARP